jgi:large subunit ribosomal protein L54
LKGLGFVKNKPEPLALEDDAYPQWLWSVLEKKASGDDVVGGEGDMFCEFFSQRFGRIYPRTLHSGRG